MSNRLSLSWGPVASAVSTAIQEEEISQEGLFDFVRGISVRSENGLTYVTGIKSRELADAIQKKWATSRVNTEMFLEMNYNSFVTYDFFLLEIVYMLRELKEFKKTRPVIVRVIDELVQAIHENTWLAGIKEARPLEFNYKALDALTVKMLPNQMEFMKSYSENVPRYGLKGYLAHSPAGTGKTLMGFGFSLATEAECTFILCPKNSLISVWEETIKTRFKITPTFWSSTRSDLPTGKEKYIICHYEVFERVAFIYQKLRGRKLLIWIDESHNFNEVSAKRTQNLMNFVRDSEAEYTVWASGTPLKAIGAEAVPLLTTIDPMFSEEVRLRFVKIFGKSAGRALDILANRIGAVSYQVPKLEVVNNDITDLTHYVSFKGADQFTLESIAEEVSKFIEGEIEYIHNNMPQTIATVERIWKQLEDGQRIKEDLAEFNTYRDFCRSMHQQFDMREDLPKIRYCKKYEEEIIYARLGDEDRKLYKKEIALYKYMVLVVQGRALGEIMRWRMRCLKEMVPHCGYEVFIEQSIKKTLIFCSYIQTVNAIAEDLRKKGYGVLVVTGETNKNLADIMRSAASDPNYKVVVASYPSLSTAVPCVWASTAIFHSAPFRDHVRTQARARLDRLGQDSPITFYTVLLKTTNPNISERAQDILEWSKANVDRMLGIKTVDDATDFDDGDERRLSVKQFQSGLAETLMDWLSKVFPNA